jgi:hypothetical protein
MNKNSTSESLVSASGHEISTSESTTVDDLKTARAKFASLYDTVPHSSRSIVTNGPGWESNQNSANLSKTTSEIT